MLRIIPTTFFLSGIQLLKSSVALMEHYHVAIF